jgi:uncharacterized membrane protein YkoI
MMIMNKTVLFLSLMLALGAAGTLVQARRTTVAPEQAMAAAEAKVPGSHALQATYMREAGKPLYDVIVLKGKTLTEVEVDPATGKAGDTEAATPEGEGKELTDQLKAAVSRKKAAPEKAKR